MVRLSRSAIRARQEAGDVLRRSGQDYVIESRGFDQKGFHLLSKWTRGNEGVGTDKYKWELSMEQVHKYKYYVYPKFVKN